MTELTEAINRLDPNLFNSIRAWVAQSLRADRKKEGVTEENVEDAILDALRKWVKAKK